MEERGDRAATGATAVLVDWAAAVRTAVARVARGGAMEWATRGGAMKEGVMTVVTVVTVVTVAAVRPRSALRPLSARSRAPSPRR
jgi:hypothetical protein